MQPTLYWKLPTFNELSSLLWGEKPKTDKGICSANDDVKQAYHSMFNNPGGWFWSLDQEDHDGRVKIVYFLDGFCGRACVNNKGQIRLLAREMRTPSWLDGDDPFSRYELDDCNAVVHDRKTGKLWKLDDEPGKYTFSELLYLNHDLSLKGNLLNSRNTNESYGYQTLPVTAI